MNQFFQSGPKQNSISGGLTQNNSLKSAIDDSLFMNSKLNETNQMNPMQKNLSYNDYLQMKEQNNNLNQNFQGMSLEQNWNSLNQNYEQQYNQNQGYKGNINYSNDYVQSQGINYVNNQNLMMPKILHPSLQEFQDILKKDMEKSLLNEGEIIVEDKQKNNEEEFNSVYQDIINVMEDQDDERHLNSDFLKFIKKLKTGEIQLNEKENNIQKGVGFIDPQEDYSKMFNNIEDMIQNDNFNVNQYKDFSNDNPYLNSKNDIDRVEKAKELLLNFKTEEAKLLLEAEVQINKDNSEAWLILGRIHSDMDDDDNAFKCLITAHETDKYNVECLFALGVQCTNSLNEFDAMINLVDYIKLHPIYSKMVNKNNPLLDYNLIKAKQEEDTEDFDQHRWEYINSLKENFYKEVISLYQEISVSNIQKDSDFYLAFGIVNFIPHNNEQSIIAFRKAVEISPNDYNCWNKLGAIYAHSKMTDLAIDCYNKAISLKPDYVRCLANLALALTNKGEKQEASMFCLRALRIQPKNTQLWFYLRSLYMDLNSNEDVSLCEKYDIKSLLSKYSVN